jgi:hypothetical protein
MDMEMHTAIGVSYTLVILAWQDYSIQPWYKSQHHAFASNVRYIAPKLAKLGRATNATDVSAFNVFMLESWRLLVVSVL